jgi:hypothetical protein
MAGARRAALQGTQAHRDMQGCVDGHGDSHCVRQLVIWWRRWASGGDEVAAVNPFEDSWLGARMGEVEWYNVMRCGIVRWWCLL